VNLFALDWEIWNSYCNFRNSGAIGLLVGLLAYFIDIVRWSCFIDVLGVGVQTKIKDGLLASSPALFYCALNLYIFIESLKSSWDKHSTLLTSL
jgi:hypothetical protein